MRTEGNALPLGDGTVSNSNICRCINEQLPVLMSMFTPKDFYQIANITPVSKIVVHRIKFRRLLLTVTKMSNFGTVQ